MEKIAIIFAGGVGSRMGANIPKQFLKVQGKPIIIHTIEKFEYHPEITKIYIACKEDLIPELKGMIKKYNITKVSNTSIVPGGETGQDSIYNALRQAARENSGDSIVLIHDGVRPVINEELISKNILSVLENGSAITCTKAFETPITCNDSMHVSAMPKRDISYTAQAPQSFYLKDIIEAHERMREINPKYEGIVDSCTLMFKLGYKVSIVEGNRDNIKVTTPEDYTRLLSILSFVDQSQMFELYTQAIDSQESKKTRINRIK